MEYPKTALTFQFHKQEAMILIKLKSRNSTIGQRHQLVINKNKLYICNKIQKTRL
jgi:hypothetical protein